MQRGQARAFCSHWEMAASEKMWPHGACTGEHSTSSARGQVTSDSATALAARMSFCFLSSEGPSGDAEEGEE